MINTNIDILFKAHEFFFNVLYLLRNPSGEKIKMWINLDSYKITVLGRFIDLFKK